MNPELIDISQNIHVNAALHFGIYLVIAVLVNFFIDGALKRLARLSKSEVDDRLLEAVQYPLVFTIIVYGIRAGFLYYDLEPATIELIRQITGTCIILFWTIVLFRVIRILISNSIDNIFQITGISRDVVPLAAAVAKFLIFVGALIWILSIWNIDVTPVLASAGILSAIIALAAKDTIANFLGGISIFLDKPYKIGDYIEFDQRDRGEVVEIGVRSTRIKTRDDVLISIPNAIIANSKIINESAPVKNFRVRIPVNVHYGSDIEQIERELVEIGKANPNILQEPEPRVRFRRFAESWLEFELLCWADEPAQRGLTIHQLNSEIYKRFSELKIQFPFPHLEMYSNVRDYKSAQSK
jgi:small-conductance mechanosensitive channel